MPGGDRTGPLGEGPRTGRAAGFCSGYDSPGWTDHAVRGGGGRRGLGMGAGRMNRRGYGSRAALGGRGMGYGRRWGYHLDVPMRAGDDLEFLRDEKKRLESDLAALARRIDEMEGR